MSCLNYVHVADSELADSLMGAVHNFRYKVSDEIVDISDEDVIGLRLDWNFSFIYNPSEKSESVKKCSDTDNSFELYNNIIFFSSDGGSGTESKEVWLT